MKTQDSNENFSDWLSIHTIELNELKKLVLKFPPQNQLFNKKVIKDKTVYSADEAWDLSAKSLRIMLPQHAQIIKAVHKEAKKCLSPKDNKSRRPFTLDQGQEALPFVSCFYKGNIHDLINVAHEFAHAVQIVASRECQSERSAFMPPLYRECCAFLGEIALIDYLEKENPEIYQQLKLIWLNENIKYLSADVNKLKLALENNHLEYSYDWNYPIARLFALMLRQKTIDKTLTKNKTIETLFASGEKASSLILIKELTEYLPIPNPLPIMSLSKEMTKYQKIGVITALFVSSHNHHKNNMSVEVFHRKISNHIKNNTLFLHFLNGKPVGYACWDKVDNKSKIIVKELCIPFVAEARFRGFMGEYLKREIEIPETLTQTENLRRVA